MPESTAPERVGEGFLGLEAQAVARDDPADALDLTGFDQAGSSDDWKERLAPARRHSGEDIGDGRGLAGRNCADEIGKSTLVGAQGPLVGHWQRRRPEANHQPHSMSCLR